MSDRAPGREAQREKLASRRSSGGLRESEVLEQERLEQEKSGGRGISPSLIGAAGGLAATGLKRAGLPGAALAATELISGAGGEEIAETEEVETSGATPSFFERAMEGISFFDLSDELKPNVGKLMKRLDSLEGQGTKWSDKSVQKIVRGLKKMVKGEGILYNPKYQPKPRASERGTALSGATGATGTSADDQLIALLDQFSQRFLG
jgi:hypothetical protein